jgi:phenylalanine-4-hydroxylase
MCAGVLSSFGELDHMRSGNPELSPFDPFAKQPKMSYKDGFQKRYFVLDSFQDGASKLREYCASITPPDIMEAYLGSAEPASLNGANSSNGAAH